MLVTVNSLLACVDFPDCHSVHLCLDAPLEKPMVLRGRFLAKIPAEAYVTRCWHVRLGNAIVWIAGSKHTSCGCGFVSRSPTPLTSKRLYSRTAACYITRPESTRALLTEASQSKRVAVSTPLASTKYVDCFNTPQTMNGPVNSILTTCTQRLQVPTYQSSRSPVTFGDITAVNWSASYICDATSM